ncbi:MAG: plasmid stabilization system [Planctomycetaceae bacterium]|nr:plasmid stabilization system [Planctomycetaceae bacterium]
MRFRVIVTETAAQELVSAADWWAENRSVEQARDWYAGFSEAIRSLSKNPERFPICPENNKFHYQIRELHYGIGKRPTHRAIFTIADDYLVILKIRHHAQRDLDEDDLPTVPTK